MSARRCGTGRFSAGNPGRGGKTPSRKRTVADGKTFFRRFVVSSNKGGLKPFSVFYMLCACRFVAASVCAGDHVSIGSSDATFDVSIYNKERTAVLSEVRAGDSVVLRLAPRWTSGVAFTKTIDSASVELLSGSLLIAQENPARPIVFPIGVSGPTDRYAIFTKLPDSRLETVQAQGFWNDRVTGRALPLYGEVCIRMRPGPPEQVVFRNPSSRSTTTIYPGIPFACTLTVCDRFGNRVDAPVDVFVRSLMPDIAVIVGGAPALTIRTDSSGLGAFQVKLTDQANTNDIARVEAEIVEDTIKSTGRSAKAAITLRRERGSEAKTLSGLRPGKSVTGWVDLRGRRNPDFSRTVRITPHGHSVVCLIKK